MIVVFLDFCFLNVWFICNKFWLINDFIVDYNIDFFVLLEMWFCGDDLDLYYFCDICLDGYVFYYVFWLYIIGGGVGIVFKNNIKVKI